MGTGKYKEWLTPENLILLKGWARDGLSDKDIANNMGITTTTLYDWKKKYSAFSEALRESKEIADKAVENALYKKATGYTIKLKKPYKVRRKEIKDGVTREAETIEYAEEEVHIPADTNAQMFWLRNRNREKWGEKEQEINSVPIVNIIAPPRGKNGD